MSTETQITSNDNKVQIELKEKDKSVNKTIVVSNLNPKLTEQNVKEFFTYCGTIIEMKMDLDKYSGQTRYFITFEDLKQTNTALQLKGTEILGLPIQITLASNLKDEEEMYEVPIGAKNICLTLQQSENRKEVENTIYVINVNKMVSTSQLIDFFGICGPICYLRMSQDESAPTKVAFIEFLDASGAKMACTLSGTQLIDKPIKVYKSKHAIFKPPIKLSRQEEDDLYFSLKKIKKKLYRTYPEKFKERSPRRKYYD